MWTLYAVDRSFVTSGARGVPWYVILSGLTTAVTAWSERSPSMLRRAAWWLVVGWAAHVAILVGLIVAGVLDLGALGREPQPLATLWFSVVTYLAALLAASWLMFRQRLRAKPGRSSGRRG